MYKQKHFNPQSVFFWTTNPPPTSSNKKKQPVVFLFFSFGHVAEVWSGIVSLNTFAMILLYFFFPETLHKKLGWLKGLERLGLGLDGHDVMMSRVPIRLNQANNSLRFWRIELWIQKHCCPYKCSKLLILQSIISTSSGRSRLITVWK